MASSGQIGDDGERQVASILSQLNRENGGAAIVLNDITLYTDQKRSNTTQIDHLVITSNEILVIETKNWSGWIFGSEKQRQWTQSFPNKQKYSHYNPVLQNEGHCRVVRKIVGNSIPVRSLIVFTGDATFKGWFGSNVVKTHTFSKRVEKVFQNSRPSHTPKAVQQGLMKWKATPQDTASHARRVGGQQPKAGQPVTKRPEWSEYKRPTQTPRPQQRPKSQPKQPQNRRPKQPLPPYQPPPQAQRRQPPKTQPKPHQQASSGTQRSAQPQSDPVFQPRYQSQWKNSKSWPRHERWVYRVLFLTAVAFMLMSAAIFIIALSMLPPR